MYQRFFQKFREKVTLSEAEEKHITEYLSCKTLRKKEFLLQESDVCKTIAFVNRSLLREYLADDRGEHIIQFASEGWTISDLYSFLTMEPATYTIDALEEAEVVIVTREAHDKLLTTQPKYETYIRLLITNAYIALQKRLTHIISAPAEDQYAIFMQTYPDLAQRVPQHMIASYMGLTPETLSRVRRKISRR